MKKSILLISLMTVAMAVFAIDYPTYKPTTPTYGGGNNGTGNNNTGTTYGGYSTVATGGTTTYGEGSAIGGQGPKRAPQPQNPAVGTTYTDDDGTTWRWDGTQWVDTEEPTHTKDPGNPLPVGSPLLMLLFAAMAAAVVAWRREKKVC